MKRSPRKKPIPEKLTVNDRDLKYKNLDFADKMNYVSSKCSLTDMSPDVVYGRNFSTVVEYGSANNGKNAGNLGPGSVTHIYPLSGQGNRGTRISFTFIPPVRLRNSCYFTCVTDVLGVNEIPCAA